MFRHIPSDKVVNIKLHNLHKMIIMRQTITDIIKHELHFQEHMNYFFVKCKIHIIHFTWFLAGVCAAYHI